MGKGSSTGNLNRHLKLHPNKVDPSTMKQVELMNNFLYKDNQRLIAADDLLFTTIESPEFGYLINLYNPSACVPTADTIKNDILKIFKNYQTKIQNLLQGSHSGENLANAFLKCLEEKKIFTKTLGITMNNAANNNTFLKEFKKIFQDAIEYISQLKFITLSTSIPVYNALLEYIKNLLNKQNTNYCPILEVCSAIRMGYEKLKKYYARTDNLYIYPIATKTYNNNYKNTFQNTDSLVESVRNDFFCIFELDNNDKDEDELEETKSISENLQ
ncbi:hypothetical protein C1646_668697 [Rhizophagus diaphanus]|nr:hypothetical protein C1646_668697 [Rhizophagus diaphanus] [Rhizophagus sp. MUCL 43196]